MAIVLILILVVILALFLAARRFKNDKGERLKKGRIIFLNILLFILFLFVLQGAIIGFGIGIADFYAYSKPSLLS